MMHRCTVLLALLATTAPVVAAPKGKAAKAHFDRGVAAYTKGDFAAAAAAFAKSNAVESDEETLFAWAQTERKLGRCKKAIELYTKLLAMKLPAANKQVIRKNVEECEALILAEEPPVVDEAPPEPAPEPAPVEEPPSTITPDRAPIATSEGRPWFKDPVGGVLVGAGIAGLAVGTVYLLQANRADADKTIAQTYDEYLDLADQAESKGRIGVVASIAGGALIFGGIIRYATAGGSEDRKTVSGWFTPSGGGVALSGSF